MLKLFSVNNIAFTLWGYPMSYIEFIGTMLYLWSAWLVAKKRMLTWPVGIISVILYMALFYQIRLYSDALEQVYYLITSIYGWRRWHISARYTDKILNFRYSSRRSMILYLGITIGLSLATGAFMSRINILLPALFPEVASFPYLDALTTIMSFTATWLMTQKRVESWCYWIVVDVIGIGLYYVKGVRFIALLYVLLLGIAINGLVSWQKTVNQEIATKDIHIE
ncbi:nicotinamide riboside transporter PnuC [Ancylothrix sp. C2]|uniref:nicotinamide riboside transporter PnuC n=1 Tax=Ancylothrix sp. D3o TaxID=2953691 RepID=UPI0021BB9FEC|nr:nicotinamide riboside transporter PnuC [Ancylothrix sp. D3o]MCT7952589.1 nicotinamide riboside transporter PnuC [Ancylothrix sp. D3o]